MNPLLLVGILEPRYGVTSWESVKAFELRGELVEFNAPFDTI